jgi:hypothetical protein
MASIRQSTSVAIHPTFFRSRQKDCDVISDLYCRSRTAYTAKQKSSIVTVVWDGSSQLLLPFGGSKKINARWINTAAESNQRIIGDL